MINHKKSENLSHYGVKSELLKYSFFFMKKISNKSTNKMLIHLPENNVKSTYKNIAQESCQKQLF